MLTMVSSIIVAFIAATTTLMSENGKVFFAVEALLQPSPPLLSLRARSLGISAKILPGRCRFVVPLLLANHDDDSYDGTSNNNNNNNEAPSSPSSSSGGWSVADDWNSMSMENPSNTVPDSRDIFEVDLATRAARRMEHGASATAGAPEEEDPKDRWLKDTLDSIHLEDAAAEEDQVGAGAAISTKTSNKNDNDDGGSYLHTEKFVDEMGREIAMLIRCNESPENMLIQEGRALPPLTDHERNDISQLVVPIDDHDDHRDDHDDDRNQQVEQQQYRATPFFRGAVALLFREHANVSIRQRKHQKEESNSGKEEDGGGGTSKEKTTTKTTTTTTVRVMDAAGVASWMRKSLRENRALGRHDPRVNYVISLYGAYGTGYLTLEDFQNLYLSTVVGSVDATTSTLSSRQRLARLSKFRSEELTGVWRDLRNHGIRSPVEVERAKLLEEIENAKVEGSAANNNDKNDDDFFDDDDAGPNFSKRTANLLDECEIVSETEIATTTTTTPKKKSSHQLVELAADKKTPVWMRDGEFVFIDEQSCIGCAQCVDAAPGSFKMEYHGRARTFQQRASAEVGIAVSVCPVNCMHYVSYEELTELENARDDGDGRSDHRHFGYTKDRRYVEVTPLHVARRNNDASHRDSWYHYLRNKCYKSNKCPQRGCYDCPRYRHDPKSNPYFQERLKRANRVRAKHFVDHGFAHNFRKAVNL